MQISTRLLLGTALALLSTAATTTNTTTAATAFPRNIVANAQAQSAQKIDTQLAKASQVQAAEPQAQSAKGALAQAAKKLQATKELPLSTAKGLPTKATVEFIKLDATTLPIIKKIPIGGDADWLAIGFGSVWVTVAKNNEVVRVDPVRNVVQARIPVDKEPCYGIGIGVDKVWVLNCQSKTLTRINPKTTE